MTRQLLSNGSMYFLRLLRRCGQATTNRPNRLVSNNRRLECGDTTVIQHSRQLTPNHFKRLACPSLFKRLTQAQHRLKTTHLRCRKLATDHFVRLTQQQATLGVTNQNPLTTEISELLSRNLTGQRPEAILRRTILGTDGNMLTINTTQNLRDMHSGGKHRNLDIRRQNLHPERLDKLCDASAGTVHFPVTSYHGATHALPHRSKWAQMLLNSKRPGKRDYAQTSVTIFASSSAMPRT